jgi:AraC-like DNA-binding protein
MSTPRWAVASGAGFHVGDYRCTAGPEDRPYEEAHGPSCVALVLSGTFRYRTVTGTASLVPGAFLLGNAAQAYECSHEHGRGDRCLSFLLAPELLESVAREVTPRRARTAFTRSDVPAHAKSAALVARARALVAGAPGGSFEELAYDVAAHALALDAMQERPAPARVTAVDTRRAIAAARFLDAHAAEPLALADLAAHVNLSAFHLLRTFRRVLGVTPHQYLVGVRVARAAEELLASEREVTDIAYDAGFGDLSHFIRTFRAATGKAPRAFRRSVRS